MILSRDQITITDLHDGIDGIDGDTYVLNILGGVRSVTYNTSGLSPSPTQTAFSFELLRNGTPVSPSSIAWSATGHLSGTSSGSTFTPTISTSYSMGKSDSISLAVVHSGISIRETVAISITKLNAGVDAKIISLNPSGLVFKQEKTGTVTPTSITLTSQAQNTSVSTWSYSVNGAAFSTTKPTWLTAPSSGVLTVTSANMKDNNITSLAVKVADSSGVYFDTVTLIRAIDGSDGSNGLNGAAPITGYLTNESITLSATNAGVVSALPISGISEFKILDGITEVSPTSVGYSLVQGSLVGCTASINSSGSISLSALTSDNGSAQFAATYNGQTIKKTISFAKSKQGVIGPEGPAGRSITSVDVWYYLSTSSTSLAGGSWSTTAPTWIDGRFMWSKTITTYSTGNPTESTPACITGAKGSTGSTGSTGATGRGVSSIVEEFYLSTSKTTQTGGNWSETMPTWSPGKYVWTRSKITYTSGTPATDTTTPLVSSEWEAANIVDARVTTEVSALDGKIDLKVAKGEVINQINVSTEGVAISANKIDVNGVATFGSLAKTFTSTPTTPYKLGDIWKNGTTTWMCKVARASGAYVAADWEKVGDVTLANTSADTQKVNGVAASTVSTGAAAGTAAKTKTDSWTYTGQTTIDGGKIQADTITAAQIAANTITATQIAANTITANKLASDVGSSLDLSSNTAITARVTTTAMNTALGGKEDSVFKQNTAPAHANGRLWLNTSVTPNQLKRSTGSAWVNVTPTSGAEIGLTDSAITQKVEANTTTLAKKTEVTQVDDAWKVAFYESVSGGENILEKTETMENWSAFTGAVLNTSQGWVYIAANGSFPYAKTQTKIRKAENYVFSVDIYTASINTASALVTHWRVVGASSWNKTTHDVSANTRAWVRISMPITVGGSGEADIEISVDCYGASSGELWYRRPQLEQGNHFSGWKPSSRELYSGITKINKDGVNVSVSSSNVNTQIAYDGLTIKDGDSILASFGEVGSVVPFLSANHIVSPSTVGIVYNQVITVGPGKQYSTINDALNGVFSGGFRYIRGEVLFNIYGDISEIVEINSLIGGKLTLQFFPGSKLYGRIFIRNCMSEIDIVSNDSSSVANMGLVRPPSGAGIGIDIVNCTHVYIRGIILAGTNAYQGIKIQRGGVLFVRDCDFSGLTDTAILAADGSLAMMTDNKGSNVGYGGWAYPGGRVYATGMIPASTNPISGDRGFTWLSGTTPTPSSYNPPAVTAKTFTQYFTSATFDTLHHGTSNVSSYYGASAAQNRWDSSNGWTDGRIRFGAEIYNFFAGGSNIQVQMRLRRKNSSHGNSGAVMPAPYNHSASYPSGATRGGWTGWATVPSSLFTSGGATLTYYNGVQGINGYAIWDAVEVWVSVTKNV